MQVLPEAPETVQSSLRMAAGFRADFLSPHDGIARAARVTPAAGPRAAGNAGTAVEMAEDTTKQACASINQQRV